MNLLDEARHACAPTGRVGRTLAMLAFVFGIALTTASCGNDIGTIAEQQAAKYESNLAQAIDALVRGSARDAERFSLAMTALDESRCEGHAALGASLALQQQREGAAASFQRAKAKVGGSVPLLVDLIAYASGEGAAPAARSDGEGTAKWESTLAEAFEALLNGDALKAEQLSYVAGQLEDGRCEIEALRGVALLKLSRPVEAKAAFESAVRQATGPEVGLLRVLEAVLGAPMPETARTGSAAIAPTAEPSVTVKPVEAPPVVPQEWCDVLVAAPDPAVVTDADGRARMMATGLPWKVRDKKTGIVMLLCPPGEFLMGSPANEAGRFDNEEQQRVSITTAFYMSETEVTQEQWQSTMGANPSYFKGASNPVEQVSWNDCQGFCQRTRLRLPSEAEWEYACRAGTTGAYAGDLDSMGWYADNSGRVTHPVRQKRANPWGLYDVHGNVWEWCADEYAARASGMQAPATAGSGSRVLRGGGWYHIASRCRSANRSRNDPGFTYDFFGFRVARTPG